MQSILSRLQHYDHVKIVVFSDHTILNDPVDQWPLCDCLLAFFSKGFPLQKATDYVKLRQPFLFNDLSIQYILQDRYIQCIYIYIHLPVQYIICMCTCTCMYPYLYMYMYVLETALYVCVYMYM